MKTVKVCFCNKQTRIPKVVADAWGVEPGSDITARDTVRSSVDFYMHGRKELLKEIAAKKARERKKAAKALVEGLKDGFFVQTARWTKTWPEMKKDIDQMVKEKTGPWKNLPVTGKEIMRKKYEEIIYGGTKKGGVK